MLSEVLYLAYAYQLRLLNTATVTLIQYVEDSFAISCVKRSTNMKYV